MRRALALVALTAAWLWVTVPSAGAHALIKSSTPEDGALLDAPPAEVAITFTEPPDLGLSEIRVLDGEGREVGTGPLQTTTGNRSVAVQLEGLGEGVYTVNWRVLSTVDGHVTAGSFSFGVGVEATAVPTAGGSGSVTVEAPSPSVLSVVGRWGFYWGLAILLGGAVAFLLVFRTRSRGLTPMLVSGWGLAAVGLIGMFWAERQAAEVSALDLLGSDRGEVLVARGVALAIAGAAAWIAVRRPRRLWFIALLVTTAAAMLVHSYAGHAGAASSLRGVKVLTQWVHLIAVGIWAGGLAWLLVGVWGTGAEERRGAVARFSTLAGIAVAVVALTGFVRAVNEVGSVGELFDSGFGLSAIAKSGLFLGLIALGAYNRYRVVPAVSSEGRRIGTLRRTVGSEVLLATGIFGITGLMAGLVPPAQVTASATSEPPSERVVVAGSDFGTSVRVRLTATPGAAGLNAFRVRLADFDTGRPIEADAVRLRFSLPERADVNVSELILEEQGPGAWSAQGTNLSVNGVWRVGVLIERGADSLQVNLDLETRREEPKVEVIEGGPGQPDLFMIELEQGRAVQAYADPGTTGSNEIHFTFFGPDGDELPISEIRISATPEGGEPQELEARRLSPGHFVAGTDLAPGPWGFGVEATSEDGAMLTATFEEEIEG